jgi:hypothetical protein
MIDGWAHAYSSYDCSDEFKTLDQHIRQALSQYCQYHGFMVAGHLVSGKQMQLLGIPSLESIRQRLSNQQDDDAKHRKYLDVA